MQQPIAPSWARRSCRTGLNSYTGTRDTYVELVNPGSKYGTMERMRSAGNGAGNYQRGYIAFDVSSIPAGTVISNATLSLFSHSTQARRAARAVTACTTSPPTGASQQLAGASTSQPELDDGGRGFRGHARCHHAQAGVSPKVPIWYDWT